MHTYILRGKYFTLKTAVNYTQLHFSKLLFIIINLNHISCLLKQFWIIY